jgi:hypothetical protein
MLRAKHRRSIKLTEETKADLIFHRQTLKKAHEGTSMNILTYRKVDQGYRSDACPAGIEGYSTEGRAWRFPIPKHLQFRATLNMLEHVASIIGPWIDIIEKTLPEFSCILSMTDSTTSAGWLKKSNFKENENKSITMTKAKLLMSREHATCLMNNNIKDYSQWFPGTENEVADSLSRDGHLSDIKLTNLYFSLIPEQMPHSFKISQLPQEIESFLSSMLQTLPEATQQQGKHKTSNLCLGQDGIHSCTASNSVMISSYNKCHEGTRRSSCRRLHKKSDQGTSAEDLIKSWSAKQSEPPWTTFLRPSESMINQTRERTEMESLADFYNNSTRAIRMKTQERNSRKHYLSALSETSTS